MAPTHAAFLRAVNLGRTRKASGERLRTAFEVAGLDEVASFRNSGNVVFAGSGSAAELTAQEPFPPRVVAASALSAGR